MPLKRSQRDIYSGQLPLLLQAELSGTSCGPFPWWPPCGLPFMAFSQLWHSSWRLGHPLAREF